MKSIDIRSESAVKLLSEFLDMDAPYVPGGRHANAEHFAHGQLAPIRSFRVHTNVTIRGLLLCSIPIPGSVRV